jgi:hypothetical protein
MPLPFDLFSFCRAADLRLQKVYNFSLPMFLSHPPAHPCIAELLPGSDNDGKNTHLYTPSFIVAAVIFPSYAAAVLVQQSLPFVIRGGVQHWPACGKWTYAACRRVPTEYDINLLHSQSFTFDFCFAGPRSSNRCTQGTKSKSLIQAAKSAFGVSGTTSRAGTVSFPQVMPCIILSNFVCLKRQLQTYRICEVGHSIASFLSSWTTSKFHPGPATISRNYLSHRGPRFTGYSWDQETPARRCT